MRPGRLDRIIYVGPPDQAGREEILRICTNKMSVESNLDMAHLARLVCTYSAVTYLRRSRHILIDRGLLWSRNQSALSGSRAVDYEAEYRFTSRTLYALVRCL